MDQSNFQGEENERKKTTIVRVNDDHVSLVLSACGGSATEAPAPEEPVVDEPVVDEPVVEEPAAEEPSGKLVIWVQQANQDVWEQTVLPGFLEEYPDVELEFVNYSPEEVANQVALAIQGGTGVPDWQLQKTAVLLLWLN